MKVRFLADVNFDERITSGLVRREADLDFQTAVEARLHGLPDSEVLKIAADSNRVLVTYDKKTMPAAFGAFLQQRNCPAVILVPQELALKLAINELLLIWNASEAEDWQGMIAQIPS